MKTQLNQVYARFSPEVAFEVTPMHSSQAVRDCELELLKQKLLKQRLEQQTDTDLNPILRRAANEAASLAWLTAYPLLVFPSLLDEKAEVALQRTRKQKRVRQESARLILESV